MVRLFPLAVSLTFFLVAAYSCENALQPGTTTFTIEWDGRQRTLHLFVPAGLRANESRPLIWNFHGYSNSPEEQQSVSRMNAKVETERWFTIHPAGTGIIPGFNGGACCGTSTDDVGLVRYFMEHLKDYICIREDAVFSTGFSNGGFMTHRLACEAADLFRGMAPVSGVIGIEGGDFHTCNPEKALTVLHSHGTLDLTVPYDGNGSFKSVNFTIEFWKEKYGCSHNSAVTYSSLTTECVRYDDCAQRAGTVELCTIKGLTHKWPQGDPVYQPPAQPEENIDITEYMFEVFNTLL